MVAGSQVSQRVIRAFSRVSRFPISDDSDRPMPTVGKLLPRNNGNVVPFVETSFRLKVDRSDSYEERASLASSAASRG